MNKKLKLWELHRPTVEEFRQQDKFPLVIALDNIRSLSNVGAVFRTADAFNVSQLILGGITAQPPHREIQKTAIGATESVAWIYTENLIEKIKEYKSQGYLIYAVEQTEKTTLLNQIEADKSKKYLLVFGNEVDGVQQEIVNMADKVIEVPQFGTKHSLNISVCVGVVLWEMIRDF